MTSERVDLVRHEDLVELVIDAMHVSSDENGEDLANDAEARIAELTAAAPQRLSDEEALKLIIDSMFTQEDQAAWYHSGASAAWRSRLETLREAGIVLVREPASAPEPEEESGDHSEVCPSFYCTCEGY